MSRINRAQAEKDRGLLEQDYALPCSKCGGVVFEWWDSETCRDCKAGLKKADTEQATLITDGGEITGDELARRGNITSDNHRPAVTCGDCRTTWYGRTDPFEHGQVATEYCPHCGGQDVEENEELPGALLLNPGVEWPGEDPFVGGERDG